MIYPRCKPIVRTPITREEAMRASSPDPTSLEPGPLPAPASPAAPVNATDKGQSRSKSPSRDPRLNFAPSRPRSPGKEDIFLKSRVDQSIHLMKLIYEKAGQPVRPGGHSQFDALGTLKSDMALKVLHKKRWADFFEDLKGNEDGETGSAAERSQFASASFIKDGRTAEELEQEKMDSIDAFRTMKKRVEQLWKELKIPTSDTDFYSYNLLRSCNGTMEQFSDISRYIVVLNNYRGSTMAVLEEIHNREFAVVNLLDFVSQIKRRSAVEDYKAQLVNCIQHVQIATINVVHQIQNWRANFWRPLPFQFRGENYLLRMQSDLDALKSESLGAILRDCGFRSADLVCVLFALENLNLSEGGEPFDENILRLVSAVPLPPLLDAAASVVGESDLQRELKLERKQLIRDGVFIPMLRYEHSLESSQSARISGGIIPPTHPSQISTFQSSSHLDDSSSRLGNTMSQVTDGSSRIDV